jgi:hypothetical protein
MQNVDRHCCTFLRPLVAARVISGRYSHSNSVRPIQFPDNRISYLGILCLMKTLYHLDILSIQIIAHQPSNSFKYYQLPLFHTFTGVVPGDYLDPYSHQANVNAPDLIDYVLLSSSRRDMLPVQLLQISKVIHEEAEGIFYGENTIMINPSLDQDLKWLLVMSTQSLKTISSIQINLTTRWKAEPSFHEANRPGYLFYDKSGTLFRLGASCNHLAGISQINWSILSTFYTEYHVRLCARTCISNR